MILTTIRSLFRGDAHRVLNPCVANLSRPSNRSFCIYKEPDLENVSHVKSIADGFQKGSGPTNIVDYLRHTRTDLWKINIFKLLKFKVLGERE
jgi:hypothetical protein